MNLKPTPKAALVTGASRGVGKGIALGLGEAGITVYITGRTVKEGQAAVGLPETIYQTTEEVNRLERLHFRIPQHPRQVFQGFDLLRGGGQQDKQVELVQQRGSQRFAG